MAEHSARRISGWESNERWRAMVTNGGEEAEEEEKTMTTV
jgi:hypothetical protein